MASPPYRWIPINTRFKTNELQVWRSRPRFPARIGDVNACKVSTILMRRDVIRERRK